MSRTIKLGKKPEPKWHGILTIFFVVLFIIIVNRTGLINWLPESFPDFLIKIGMLFGIHPIITATILALIVIVYIFYPKDEK